MLVPSSACAALLLLVSIKMLLARAAKPDIHSQTRHVIALFQLQDMDTEVYGDMEPSLVGHSLVVSGEGEGGMNNAQVGAEHAWTGDRLSHDTHTHTYTQANITELTAWFRIACTCKHTGACVCVCAFCPAVHARAQSSIA